MRRRFATNADRMDLASKSGKIDRLTSLRSRRIRQVGDTGKLQPLFDCLSLPHLNVFNEFRPHSCHGLINFGDVATGISCDELRDDHQQRHWCHGNYKHCGFIAAATNNGNRLHRLAMQHTIYPRARRIANLAGFARVPQQANLSAATRSLNTRMGTVGNPFHIQLTGRRRKHGDHHGAPIMAVRVPAPTPPVYTMP